MSSIRDRLSQYENSAANDDEDEPSRAPTHADDRRPTASSRTPRSNTPLIIRKARNYEKQVKELRADQENPASQSMQTADGRATRPPRAARSNTPMIVRKAREYEKTVQELRADQENPAAVQRHLPHSPQRAAAEAPQRPSAARGAPRSNTPLIVRKARDYEKQVKQLREDQENPAEVEKARQLRHNSAVSTPARSNTPLIVRKARDYEKQVLELRADQENPGILQKKEVPSRPAPEPSSTPARSNTPLIIRKARDYEKTVEVLRADQDTPGLMAKHKSQLEGGASGSGDSKIEEIEEKVEADAPWAPAAAPSAAPSRPIDAAPAVSSTQPARATRVAAARRNTPLIVRKAKDYEQSVKDLRADQEKPGTLERLQSARHVTKDAARGAREAERQRKTVPAAAAAAAPPRSNTPLIIRRARDYEQSVRDLRADQEKPGTLERLQSQRQSSAMGGSLGVHSEEDEDEYDAEHSEEDEYDAEHSEEDEYDAEHSEEEAVIEAAQLRPTALRPAAAPTRSNTPLIIRKAREYEQNVRDLRADQEKPGALDKLKKSRDNVDAAEVEDQVPPRAAAAAVAVAVGQRNSPLTVRKVSPAADGRSDEQGSTHDLQLQRHSDDFDGIGAPIVVDELPDVDDELDDYSTSAESGDEVQYGVANELPAHALPHKPSDAKWITQRSGAGSASGSGASSRRINPDELPMSAPKLDTFVETAAARTPPAMVASHSVATPGFTPSRSVTPLALSQSVRLARSDTETESTGSGSGASFHSAAQQLQSAVRLPGGSGLSWSDGFDSLTDSEVESEGIVTLETLVPGHEFTNDAVLVEEEQELPPGHYLQAARRGDGEGASAPAAAGSSGRLDHVESLIRPAHSDRARPNSAHAVRGERRQEVRPITVELPLHTAAPEEDAGVRNGWRREQSDRLPKAKVVIARRGSGGDEDGGTLVKQYKDRAELLEGRVSRVELRASRLTAQREERKQRHAAGVARRSSLVHGALDRVSMAADPFIDFMADKGGVVPGPRKPRSKLRKMLRRLFKGQRRQKELIKGGASGRGRAAS